MGKRMARLLRRLANWLDPQPSVRLELRADLEYYVDKMIDGAL